MREDGRLALGTKRDLRSDYRMMAAPLPGAGFRMASLGNWHESVVRSLLKSWNRVWGNRWTVRVSPHHRRMETVFIRDVVHRCHERSASAPRARSQHSSNDSAPKNSFRDQVTQASPAQQTGSIAGPMGKDRESQRPVGKRVRGWISGVILGQSLMN